MLHNALVVTGIVVLAYFAILNLILLIFTAIGWRQVTLHARARVYGGAEEAFSSPLTPAISVLVPAFNEEAGIIESVRSLVRLRYSQHEVIVINDGSTDGTLAKLQREFDLVAVRKVLRDSMPVRPVRTIYISRRHPELIVIDKENGGKADALNTGLNAARYPYVCAVDADALLDEDALLYVAKPILDDPERTVATGGIVRIANGCRVEDGMVKEVGLPRNRLATLQVIEYFRAFLIGRVGWSEIDSLLIISGAFGLFRRSLLEAVGGYWTETVGEDVELVVRLHGYLRKRGEDYRIAFVPHPVCWTEVPEDLGTLMRQRRRWQRGLGEALWRHRAMIGRPRDGVLGLVAIPYFLVFELLGPIIELVGYLALPIAVAVGELSTSFLWAGLILAVLFGLLLSIAALALEEFSFRRHRSAREVGRTLAYAVLENFGFRQIMGVARLIGLLDLVGRRQRWGSMRRRGLGSVQLASEATSLTDAGVPARTAPDRRKAGSGDGGTGNARLLSRRFRVVLALAAAVELAGVAVWMLHATTGLGSPGRDAAFTRWIYPTLYLLPACFCIVRGWVGRRERLAWLALGAGLVVAGAGWLNQGLVIHGLDGTARAPIRAALGVGFSVVTAVGLLLLLRLRTPGRPRIPRLDGLAAALTLAALAALVINPVVVQGMGRLSVLATYPVVPLGDLVLLVVVAVGMASLGWRPDRAWALVGAALMIRVATDSVYLSPAAEGASSRGTLLEAGGLAAACLIGFAAWRVPGTARAKRGEARIALVAPFFFAVGALVVLDSASLQRVNGRGNSAAAVLASAALLVSVLRSGLSLAEQRRLRAAAFGDPLTGLLNYSGFHTLVENEIQRAQRSDAKFCVLTYKLDGLKRLNELRGHREGDRELRRLADAIRSSIRSTDIPARIAGADFAVVFPATSRAGALAAAERLKRLVAVLDEPVNVTVGVAEWPMDGPGKERLLRRADIALYEFNQPQPGKQPTIELTPLANETGDSGPDSSPDSSPSDDDESALLPGAGRDGSGL